MTYDNQNIFAKILRGEIPCDKIYEDDEVLCFKDINPIESIRYVVNMFPLISICTGSVIYFVYNKLLIRRYKHINLRIGLLMIAIIIPTMIFTLSLRTNYFFIEQENRLKYINDSLKILDEESLLITEYPLLFQLFGDNKLSIVDFNLFKDLLTEDDLNDFKKKYNVFLHREVLNQRYLDISREKDVHIFFDNQEREIIFSEKNEFCKLID